MFEMVQQVYSEDALSCSVVFRWYQPFFARKKGRDSLEGDVCTDRPQTFQTKCKIQEVPLLVHANCSQSVDDLAAAVGVRHGTCYEILTDDLNMSCYPAYCATNPVARPM